MHSLLCASLFGLLVRASPAPLAADSEAATIPLIKSSKVPLDGPAQRRKVFHKMGWTVPDTPSSTPDPTTDTPFDTHIHAVAASHADIGRVQATPEAFKSEYLCPVTIGNQELMLNFDTGSADLWVFSRYLDRSVVGDHTAFNPRQSPTFVNDTRSTWAITYADSSGASGLVGYDTVTIGGVSQANQAVELATEVSDQFEQDTNSDGLVGLGFDILNRVQPKRVQSWFQHVKHALNKRVFSVNLKEDGSGFYEFGRITPGAYRGALTRVPCDMTNGWWEFESPAFSVDGQQYYNFDNPSPAIADTGTTLLIVDPQTASFYYSQIPNSGYSDRYGGWLYPCSQASSIPTFGISLGSADFIVEIPRNVLTYGSVDGYYCYGAVQDNDGNPLQILGDVLYRSAFVAHLDWRGVKGTNGFLGLSVGQKA